MSFQIVPLERSAFADLFDLTDAQLAQHRARRLIAEPDSGLPCRVSLEDAIAGETVLLVNYTHHETDTPYRASHAIVVRQDAQTAQLAPGEIPAAISNRLISVRLFDAPGNIVGSDVLPGGEISAFLSAGLAQETVAFAHLHYARNGCFAAKAVRV